MNISDNLLVEQLKKGSEKAFDSLYRFYYPGLCLFGKKYVNDLETAEEIVQDVFIKIWERRENLIPETLFKTYLYTSVRNGCIDFLRKQKVRDNYSKDFIHTNEATTTEEETDDLYLINQIKQAIDRLPKQRKKIVKMNRYFGLKYKEIAEKLNISPKTVENQMGIALKQLREALKDIMTLIILIILYNYWQIVILILSY